MVAVHLSPLAVIVTEAASWGAVHVTLEPVVAERLPPVVVHEAEPSENVRVTASPTPTFVRALVEGTLATVSEVMLHTTGLA